MRNEKAKSRAHRAKQTIGYPGISNFFETPFTHNTPDAFPLLSTSLRVQVQMLGGQGSHRTRNSQPITCNPQPNIRSQRTEVRRQISRLQIVLLNAPCPMPHPRNPYLIRSICTIRNPQSEIRNRKTRNLYSFFNSVFSMACIHCGG